MQFPGDHTQHHLKNRRIPTFRLQKLKHSRENCMRNVEDAPEQALSVRNGTHSTPAHNKPPQP